MAKRGRLSQEDLKFIETMCNQMPIEEVAENLDRTPQQIKEPYERLKKEKKAKPDDEVELSEEYVGRVSLKTAFKNSETFRQLQDEFEPQELRFFEEQYVALLSQFSKDQVTASEETQILQSIKCQVLMHRNLADRLKLRRAIDDLSKMQSAMFEDKDPKQMSDKEREQVISLETHMNQMIATESSKTVEYTKLQEQSNKLLQSMKSTRDQRLERIEKDGIDFMGIVRKFQQDDIQKREGRQNELMKLATAKVYAELGKPHFYVDGTQDHPILCAETVDISPDEEEEEEKSDE